MYVRPYICADVIFVAMSKKQLINIDSVEPCIVSADLNLKYSFQPISASRMMSGYAPTIFSTIIYNVIDQLFD